MIMCPNCHSTNYQRSRSGTIIQHFKNGQYEGVTNQQKKWGYDCMDCRTKWYYEKGKAVLGWF